MIQITARSICFSDIFGFANHALTKRIDAFTRASRLDPADTVALCMVGLTLDKLGRDSEAATYYQQALKIKPGDEMAARLMTRLDVHE